MFCGKCGTNNPENVKFCSKCGAQLGDSGDFAAKSQAAKKPVKANKAVGIVIAAVVVVAVAAVTALVLTSLLSGGGCKDYNETAGKYIDAMYSVDGKAVVDLIPKKCVKRMLKEDHQKKSELIDDLNSYYGLGFSFINNRGDVIFTEDVDNWTYSYETIDVKEVDREEFKSYRQAYREYYGIKISEIKEVLVEIKVHFPDNNQTFTEEMYVPVVKIGSSWYLNYATGRIRGLR